MNHHSSVPVTIATAPRTSVLKHRPAASASPAGWAAPRLGRLLLPLLLAAIWFAGSPAAPAAAQDFDNLPAARIEKLPTWHGGSTFTFELHFAENTNLSFRDVRDGMFEVNGGRVFRAPRIDKSSNQSFEVYVQPDGFGDITISGLGMTASVPGPGDRLAARITELPSRHDGEKQFTARLDFNRSPNLEWRNVRDHVVVVTGGDVNRSPRVVKGDNAAWTLMITPDGDGTVGIAVPITGSCGNQADVCDHGGTMLADGAWRTVRGPAGDTLTRPENTVRQVETQPTIRQDEPSQTESPGPTGASDVTGQQKTACTHFLAQTATSFTYNLDCDDQLTQFNAYLNHASKTHTYSSYQVSYKIGSGNWQLQGGTNPASISLPYSGTSITYDVCISPFSTVITLLPSDGDCNDDSSGQTSGTRGETRVIALSAPFTLQSISDAELTTGTAANLQLPAAVGASGTVSYRLEGSLPSGLSFNPSNRRITGTPNSAATATVTLVVTDSAHPSIPVRRSFTITVIQKVQLANPGTLSFVIDTAGSTTLPAATDGKGTKTYNLSPALPTGLSRSGFTISGTPTSLSSATYTWTVTDDTGSVAVQFTLAVTPPSLNVPAPSDIYATVGVSIGSIGMPVTTEGAGNKTYKITGAPLDLAGGPEFGPGLPASLSFNPSTRVLSGTPDHTLARRRLAYHATDTAGATGYSVFTLRIGEPLSLARPDDMVMMVAEDHQIVPIQLPRASGGHQPYSYSVSELPFGLRYDQGRHEINGTPRYPAPPPGVEIVLTARDQAGNAVERAFNIEILACALTLDPLADRTFTAGSSIDPLTLPAARAPCGAVTYSVNGLPAGLMFDPETRTLSGTPTATSFTVAEVEYRAHDGTGNKGTTFTVMVHSATAVCGPNWDAGHDEGEGPIDIDSDLNLPDVDELLVKVGQPMRVILPAATGGEEPLTYVMRGLPDSMCFDPGTRELSGVPHAEDFLTPDYIVMGPNRTRSETYVPINVYD